MAFQPSAADLPPRRDDPDDPRFTELFTDDVEAADIHFAGVPYDASVLGRRGAREGPRGIREAFRFLSHHDPTGTSLERLRLYDHGDVAGLDDEDVLATHATVREAVRPLLASDKPTVLLGGDHGLTFAHVQALADAVDGDLGIVVVDAHYDLRGYDGQPSSGTPFRRILTELDGRVAGRNLAEIGIRPYANTRQLAEYAGHLGVHVASMQDVREKGIAAATEQAMDAAGDGTEHIWLSIDIDGLDQSVAAGCSAPGAGGLTFEEGRHVVEHVGRDARCRGMDVLEVAPGLDPTGNTCRTAAQLIAHFCGAVQRRHGM